MILDSIRSYKRSSERESQKVSLLKTISWRVIGTLDTMVISYILTGNVSIAFGIGGVEVISKMVLYYIHERAWARYKKDEE